jgi:hypothetical protein
MLSRDVYVARIAINPTYIVYTVVKKLMVAVMYVYLVDWKYV